MDLHDVIKTVEDHNSRICNIEVNKGMVDIQLQNLIKSVDQLISNIRMMLFSVLGIGVGFIIWYVQQL